MTRKHKAGVSYAISNWLKKNQVLITDFLRHVQLGLTQTLRLTPVEHL